MCMVSVIFNHGFGYSEDFWKYKPERFEDFKYTVEQAEVFDAEAGHTDCAVNEEEKKAFMEKIEGLAYGDETK